MSWVYILIVFGFFLSVVLVIFGFIKQVFYRVAELSSDSELIDLYRVTDSRVLKAMVLEELERRGRLC